MNENSRNTIIAVILYGLVLIAWHVFYKGPQRKTQRPAQQAQAKLQKPNPPAAPATSSSPPPQPGAAPSPAPAAAAPQVVSRETAIAATPRVTVGPARLTSSVM